MQLEAVCDKFLGARANEEDVKETVVAQITTALANREIELLQLVSALGEYLVNDDSTIRSKSMALLQRVLTKMPDTVLKPQQISVVVTFFCDRLSDEVCLSETLAALIAITNMHDLSSQHAESIAVSTLDQAKHSPSLPQRVKFQIYTIIEKIMARHRPALLRMKNKFVSGFADLMTGEKDPRNLMLAFSIMKVILEEFETHFMTQDLFDVVYCYFPITFRPPPDDPTTITTEDLKSRLRDCLGASPSFAPYLIPALIEKLNAVAVSVKKDTLLTLQHCCASYSADSLDLYGNELWQALKYEIIQSEESRMEELAMDVVTSVTACFAGTLTEMPKPSPLSRWLQPIVVEALQQLREPELKSAKPCGKILYSVSVASPICLDVVLKAVAPGLLAICQESDSASKSTTLFEVLLNLLKALSNVQDKQTSGQVLPIMSEVVLLRDNLLTVLFRGLVGQQPEDFQLRRVSLKCLEGLVKLRHVLDHRDLGNLSQHLNEVLLEDNQEMRDAALSVLNSVAEIRVQMILDISIPALLAQLPQEDAPTTTNTSQLALEALSGLAVRKEVMDCLIVRFLSRVQGCLRQGPIAQEYLLELLSALYNGISHFSGNATTNAGQFYDKLAVELYRITFSNRDTIMTSPAVLLKSSQIINLIARQCFKEKQEIIADDLVSVFLLNKSNKLILQQDPQFAPFETAGTNQETSHLLILFIYTLAALNREIALVANLNQELLFKTIELTQMTKDIPQRRSLCTLITLIINKASSNQNITHFLASLDKKLDIKSPEHVDITFAIAKALILRSHPQFKDIMSHLIPNLASPRHGRLIASQFQNLLEQDPVVIKENFANIKLLNKQKFYSFAVPVLIGHLNSADSDVRPNYLIALSRVISLSSQAVYTADFTIVLPVLLECITLPDTDTKRMSITTIDAVVLERKDDVGAHLSTLIPSLLSCIRESEHTPPRTRMVSLHLLGSLVDVIRTDKLQPYKTRVIRALTDSLDDKKRLVRREAVITRQKYFVAL